MHSRRLSLIAFGILAGCAVTGLAQGPSTPTPKGQAPKNYSSPTAVFDAYREACTKGDTRAELSCMAPEMREGEVFQAFIGCHLRPDKPEVIAVLKKFGVEDSVIKPEYYKRYQA